MMSATRRLTTLLLLVVLCDCLAREALADDKGFEYGWSFVDNTNDRKTSELSWTKIVQELNGSLVKAKQVNLYIDACHAGGIIDKSAALEFPFVIGTPTTAEQKTEVGYGVRNQNPPGYLRGTIDTNEYYFSYHAYLAKRLRNRDPIPTAKQLHDAAAGDYNADPRLKKLGTPQYKKSSVEGGDKKTADDSLRLNAGTKNAALMFASDLQGVDPSAFKEMYKAVKAMNFDHLKNYVHTDSAGDQFGGTVTVTGKGTQQNFGTALGDLKTFLDAGEAATRLVNLFLYGHGARMPLNQSRRNGAVPGAAKQGVAVVNSGLPEDSRLAIPMDDAFWSALKVDVTDFSGAAARGSPPKFFVAYSEASVTQPVNISIGGMTEHGFTSLPLGVYSLPGSSTGGLVSVTLEDSYTRSLIETFDGTDELTLQFDLAPGEWFRLALEDDMLYDPLYTEPLFGAGLMEITTFASALPEPATGVMTLFGAAICWTHRRGWRSEQVGCRSRRGAGNGYRECA
jgi:hypothetical protein